ncbi:hypothetical protein EI94DRAFT_658324 [Lactarius quietus]|nr:hypothetical protein EI94DRAFT_658324 [Lactarius quietus]
MTPQRDAVVSYISPCQWTQPRRTQRASHVPHDGGLSSSFSMISPSPPHFRRWSTYLLSRDSFQKRFLNTGCIGMGWPKAGYLEPKSTIAVQSTAPFAQTFQPSLRSSPGFFVLKYADIPTPRNLSPTNSLHRVPFDLIVSLIMLTILHDASVLNDLIILTVNYALASRRAGHALLFRYVRVMPRSDIISGFVTSNNLSESNLGSRSVI